MARFAFSVTIKIQVKADTVQEAFERFIQRRKFVTAALSGRLEQAGIFRCGRLRTSLCREQPPAPSHYRFSKIGSVPFPSLNPFLPLTAWGDNAPLAAFPDHRCQRQAQQHAAIHGRREFRDR